MNAAILLTISGRKFADTKTPPIKQLTVIKILLIPPIASEFFTREVTQAEKLMTGSKNKNVFKMWYQAAVSQDVRITSNTISNKKPKVKSSE